MYKNIYRLNRISQEIKKEISYIIQKFINDPRLNQFSTILDVIVSKDLSYAKIYVSTNKINDNLKKSSIEILNHASSYIRFLLGKNLKLRIIPQLVFFDDNSYIEGNKISNLLKTLK
ncbi:30S ribosome-binding factor RbfA [Buchnera aphidicola]|uniref:30S ribosome-binding factor RbfA n=1 Tax=Buchnera aphidicola TaxID=9 RepID=UPI00223720DE|nr:30S ribosome-binding factor RbfA [Buchnera aphidicola]MCW5197583.1 30S ribosome-binding factor RbfA [Buchnera aphidicola (Chaitophorus viminalis)]